MPQPSSRLPEPARVAALLVVAFVLAGCGAGGLVMRGDRDTGKKLFVAKCGGCHTLAAAGTSGTVGPNLDDSFAEARANGFKESAIADIVAGQIRAPGQYATGTGLARLQANMPPHLVKGQQLDDVAAFVAANAGMQGFTQQTAVTGTNGQAIFKTKCGGCHTLAAAGTTGTTGPNLDQLKPSFAIAKAQVEHGGGVMPAFKGVLTDAQISAVAKYVSSHAGK
ncbi:MAG TPA: c-type cytochrome [Gaiellaceae bacterium]|nr:c-type cytochrome [Gaiellaceae bacterium]